MRLLDTYALNCGAKIDKPFLYDAYFPLPVPKYITFQAQAKYESKDYSYWQDVIDIIHPFISKLGIEIVQVGNNNEGAYQRVIDIRGRTTLHQLAYVIRNSMLHLGPDSLGVHIASSYDIPLVGLYSVIYAEVAGPHFGTPEKQVLFKGYERIKNKKPSFANQEDPKSINTIKPEEVANAVLKLLGIDFKIPFETVYTGNRYCNKMIREFVTNTTNQIDNVELPVELRFDLGRDEKILAHHLSYLKRGVIITDAKIDLNILLAFKPNIPLVVYKVTENDDPEFVKNVIAIGIPTLLVSYLTQEEVDKKKINYYEFGPINVIGKPNQEVIDKLKPDYDKLYYKSCKLIASNGKVFNNQAAMETGVELRADFEYQKLIDSPKFWEDSDFITIVKKLD